MHDAKLYSNLPNKMVQCQACAWKCKIRDGQTGICGVRQNRAGKLDLLVYGKAVGMHLDPVEKKPLFHFLPGSTALSFGTLGCNFGCEFCQNWEMSQGLRQHATSDMRQAIDIQSEEWKPKEIVNKALELRAKAIAYTYNEPTIFAEYAHDTAVLAKKAGLKNIFVSNGFESKETLEYMKGYLDAINIDIKSFREDFYRKYCKAKLAPVLETVKRAEEMGIHVEITTLIIPGENDSESELKQIAEYIGQVSPAIPWHVTAFHPDYKMTNLPETPDKTLLQAYKIGKQAGLKYVYMGNILDTKHATTYCPECSTDLIKRTWHEVEITDNFDANEGVCTKCGERIEGVWN